MDIVTGIIVVGLFFWALSAFLRCIDKEVAPISKLIGKICQHRLSKKNYIVVNFDFNDGKFIVRGRDYKEHKFYEAELIFFEDRKDDGDDDGNNDNDTSPTGYSPKEEDILDRMN